jgi:hypothetical protein
MAWLNRHRNELFVFTFLLICYSYFLPRWASWNQNSRLDLVLAIVDERTFSIRNYYQNTGDYLCYNRALGTGGCENGGDYFSDKAPGTSFLAVPVYGIVRPILQSAPVQQVLNRLASSQAFSQTLKEDGSGLLTDKIYFAIVLYIVTVSVVAIPSALLGVFIHQFLGIFSEAGYWRIGTALLYGLATNAFPYSGSFMGHQIVAFLLFGAFYIAYLIGQRRISVWWTLLVGLMLGYAVITEYPTALIAGAIFLYTLFVLPSHKWRAGLVLAGLPPGLLMMSYDWIIFGTIMPVGYQYSELYKDNVHSEGFVSLVGPRLDALWGIMFGSYRGLFFIAPILLLAIPGFIAWWRRGQYRPELFVCLWAVISFLLFNGSSVMWQGGFSIGPRYLLPMVPFLATGLGLFILTWGARGWAKLTIALLGGYSFFAVWAQTIGGQSFPDWTVNPLVNYSIPNLVAGDIARNLGMAVGLSGFKSLIPLLAVLVIITLLWKFVGNTLSSTEATPVEFLTNSQQKELHSDV